MGFHSRLIGEEQYEKQLHDEDLKSQIGEGENFFERAQFYGQRIIFKGDLPRYESVFTKENVMREIRKNGLFVFQYRLMLNDLPQPVSVDSTISAASIRAMVFFMFGLSFPLSDPYGNSLTLTQPEEKLLFRYYRDFGSQAFHFLRFLVVWGHWRRGLSADAL